MQLQRRFSLRTTHFDVFLSLLNFKYFYFQSDYLLLLICYFKISFLIPILARFSLLVSVFISYLILNDFDPLKFFET